MSERLRLHVATGAIRPDGEPLTIHFGSAELTEGMIAADLVATADLALLSSKSEAASPAGCRRADPQPARSETA